MNTNVKKQKEEKKKKRFLFWIFFFLIILLCFLFAHIILSPHKEILYDRRAVSYDNNKSHPNLKASEAAFPGFSNFTVTNPGKEVSIALVNPKYNSVDLKFEVTLDNSSSSKLLQTKLIAPGEGILKIKTPNHGKKGNYPLEIKIQAFKKSQHHEPLNSLVQKITMTIK